MSWTCCVTLSTPWPFSGPHLHPWNCWRRSWRGYDCQVIGNLNPGNRRLLPPPLSSEYSTFFPLFPQWDLFQEHRCSWDHLDWIYDWTLLRFWPVGVKIYLSCSHARPASYIISLANSTCSLLICSCLSLFFISPFPLCMGSSFRFHPGSSPGREPTEMSNSITSQRTSSSNSLWLYLYFSGDTGQKDSLEKRMGLRTSGIR